MITFFDTLIQIPRITNLTTSTRKAGKSFCIYNQREDRAVDQTIRAERLFRRLYPVGVTHCREFWTIYCRSRSKFVLTENKLGFGASDVPDCGSEEPEIVCDDPPYCRDIICMLSPT